MSTDGPIPITAVPECPCKHKAPPLGTNTTCPFAPPYTCGGPTYCGFCRANAPKVEPVPPIEPDSVAGWFTGPDGVFEVASSGDRPIPPPSQVQPSARHQVDLGLYAVAQVLADALQSRNHEQAEEALEEWRMFRAHLERTGWREPEQS